jgi:transposase
MKKHLSKKVIGIDLGDQKHIISVLERRSKEVLEERSITNHPDSLRRLSKKHRGALIALEVGTHSPWISRFLKNLGHEVLVANPRKVRAISENDRKCDLYDARMLAKLAAFDPAMLYPIEHQSEQVQRDFLQIKLRDSLVRRRVDLIASVRGVFKSLGLRLKLSNTNYFGPHTRKALQESDPTSLALIEPILDCIETMSKQIKTLDREIEQLAQERYPQTMRLREIRGVGPITALTFVLVIGDVERFAKARDVGPYLGLVPQRNQSGDHDPEMRISRKGNAYLRSLLISCAQYLLGPFGTECDLRNHGLKLVERGGRRAKKKAVVATARKLAVVMLSLLKSDGKYEPIRKSA